MAGRNRDKAELTFWKASSSAVISQFQWEKNNVLKHEILQLGRRKNTIKGQIARDIFKEGCSKHFPRSIFRTAFKENQIVVHL